MDNLPITTEANGSGALMRIQVMFRSLGKAEQRVAAFVLDNAEQLIHLSITELAEKTETSEATVVRLCKKTGFHGYQDLKIQIAQDVISPWQSIHKEIVPGDDAAAVLNKVFSSTIETLQYTLKVVNAQHLAESVHAIRHARLVDVYGLGNSASVAVDFHHKLSRSGIACRVATDNHLQMIYATTLSQQGVAIGISHSGSSRDVVEALQKAKESGATVICITNFARSPITKVADICLFTASEETRFRILGLASRIAQLTIIDTIHALLAIQDVDSFNKTTSEVLDALQQKMY